ncbi:MAG: LysM peptidoglycan-binding domain-containing protein [Firmicutes bacterium]|nr:LysM peptidoglycan-binding domain-containing protein [Bacillota bacterium]
MNKERTFSTRRFLVGRAGPHLRLVFREEVMVRLDQFAHLHAHGEHGGFLIGRKKELKSAENYEVFVERFVPIPQQKDASRLVINEEHWHTVLRALGEGDQGEEIVGWVHTHPGFGVFLSNFDKEQHLRFFSQPWQIAYVIDTQAQERAVYHVLEGKWRRLGGYYVLRQMPAEEIGLQAGRPRISWLRLGFLTLLLALLAGAGVYGFSWLKEFVLPPSQPPKAETLVVESPLPEISLSREKAGAEEEKGPESREEAVAPPEAVASPEPSYDQYVVVAGDNLWRIADKLWGDPSLFRFLAEENEIENPSIIRVGRVLKVPPKPESE